MKNTKKAFTIVELVATMIILMVIMGSVVQIAFKKQKTPSNKVNDTNRKVFNSQECPSGEALWTVENPEANEFYTVELIGGGAGGTTNARGGAGESKAVYYPSLRGTYKIVLGAGGEAENNGKPTIFYRCKNGESDCTEILDYALGGIATNEESLDENWHVPNLRDDLNPSDVSGYGGENYSKGQMGEVIVRW